jgi:hypothetical protein
MRLGKCRLGSSKVFLAQCAVGGCCWGEGGGTEEEDIFEDLWAFRFRREGVG